MKNTCFKSERRPAMADYPLILGENLSFSNTTHQIPRHFVLNFDFKIKLNSRCSNVENVVRILILRAGLRAKSLLFFKKKNAYLPTQILNLKKWEQRYFLSWPYTCELCDTTLAKNWLFMTSINFTFDNEQWCFLGISSNWIISHKKSQHEKMHHCCIQYFHTIFYDRRDLLSTLCAQC